MQSKRKTIRKEPHFISLLIAITSEFVGRLRASISLGRTQKSGSLCGPATTNQTRGVLSIWFEGRTISGHCPLVFTEN